jgi:hypothetical protein
MSYAVRYNNSGKGFRHGTCRVMKHEHFTWDQIRVDAVDIPALTGVFSGVGRGENITRTKSDV